MFENFKNEWTGKRIDFDHVFGFQCVDLILQYLYECFHITGVRGNAIDYWNDPSAPLLQEFHKVASSDAIQGDIVIFLAGDPEGHVGIATGNITATEIEILEQNGGGGGDGLPRNGRHFDEIGTRWLARAHVAGILRPNGNGVASPGAPAAPPATATEDAYEVKVNLNGYQTSNAAANHSGPAVSVPAGTYHVFNQARGMVNVTRQPGTPGSWINPNDNVRAEATPPAPADYDGESITVQPGWGLSNAAAAAGWPDAGQPARWSAIAALNGSGNWQDYNAGLKAGERIKVGKYEAPAPKPGNIVYSKLEAPLSLVTNKAPTHLWDLGFSDDAHAASVNTFEQGAGFTAYGKAQRTDGDRPCYYMTEGDFGDADTTGTPNSNRGINTVDLSTAPQPAANAPVDAPAQPSAPASDEGEKIAVTINHNAWQNTYTGYLSPQKDLAVNNAVIHDLEGRLPDKQLIRGQEPTIAGKFVKDGAEYALTLRSATAEPRQWYGIPTSVLQSAAPSEGSALTKLLSEVESDTKKVVTAAKANGLVSRFLKKK